MEVPASGGGCSRVPRTPGIIDKRPPIFQFSTRKQGFLAERSSQARRNRQHTDFLWKFRHLVAVAPESREHPVLSINGHRSFNSARGNKAFWPNGHLKRDATANTLISYGSSGIWWRLLQSPANTRYYR